MSERLDGFAVQNGGRNSPPAVGRLDDKIASLAVRGVDNGPVTMPVLGLHRVAIDAGLCGSVGDPRQAAGHGRRPFPRRRFGLIGGGHGVRARNRRNTVTPRLLGAAPLRASAIPYAMIRAESSDPSVGIRMRVHTLQHLEAGPLRCTRRLDRPHRRIAETLESD